MPAVPHVQAQQQQNNLQAQQAPPQLPPLGNGAANGSTANLIAPSQGPSPASTQVDMGPSPTSTFGVDLGDQLARDEVEIPKVVLKCTQAIEAYGKWGKRYAQPRTSDTMLTSPGLDSMGIYRISGTTSRVQALKNALDKGERREKV